MSCRRREAAILAVIGVAALAAAPSALAQSEAEMMRSSCGADIRQLCRVVPPGQGRVFACLVSRQADVSDRCRAFLRRMGAPERGAAPPPEPPPPTRPQRR